MAIEAPLSTYKKRTYMYIIFGLLAAAVIFGYDGYLSKYEWSMRHDFYVEHVVNNGGVPDGDMQFNQKSPPVFLLISVAFAVYYFSVIAKKNIVAEENDLICGKTTIAYDAIEKVNKTHFDAKGYFILTYSENGQEKELKVSDRTYDNLPAVLDHIVSKIS